MTVHQLKTQPIGPDKPSLSEMCDVLWSNIVGLDIMDRGLLRNLMETDWQGSAAKIEAIEEARAIAWSILNRHGLAEGL